MAVAAGIAVAGRTAETVLGCIEAPDCIEAAVGMSCSLAETRRIQIADSLTCCLEGLEAERTARVLRKHYTIRMYRTRGVPF